AGSAQAVTEVGAKAVPAPQVFGWLEEVMLDPDRRWKLVAKLDTGADTSSLDARDIRRVRVGNKRYVRFTVTDPETGEPVSLRRPYVRTVRIRQHDGDHERRRVVLMAVCLGEKERTIEVTLTNRAHFDYSMLLGRSALSGIAVVDPQLARTTAPTCWASITGETNETASDIAPVVTQ
ncbi:MAG: ATP-dependent zinc protease, partial [Gammaproteobacteria bacterium]|nr:ATP-dependent zinc protease [Gammaproteobacteria bacterium]